MGKKKKEDKTYLLGLGLLLLSSFFIFLFFLPETEKIEGNGTGTTQSKEFESKVNKHLFKTSQSIEMSREKMKMEADRLADRGIGPKALPKEDVHRLDFSADPRAEALLKELGRDVKESTGPTNADEAVQADLFESQQDQAYSEAYKKEYARQFVENARKAGYIIKLNDDYKVILVTPIRKPAENMQLFPTNGGGAQ
jgi:hypothetical protein